MSNSEFKKSDNNRRSFLKKSALATAAIYVGPFNFFTADPLARSVNQGDVPWYRGLTRWGQTNITEKDPEHYDIDWWRKHWKRTETQGIVVNAGGIVAYYPSRVPLHRQAQYLKGIDLFGNLCRAAHEEGVAVFARMDSNRAHEEFYRAHPDWFAIDSAGNPYKAGDLYISCVNSPYYNEHLPAVLREIAELYKPEGFTDNSWSGLDRESICYCEYCKKSFKDKTGKEIPSVKNWDDQTYREWIRWNYDRRLEIWDMNNRITKKAGGSNCIWVGMNSGSISSQSRRFRDYKEICQRADMIMLDHQARRDSTGFQHNGEIGKLIHGLVGWDKLIPESMAMYQAGSPTTFRVASKPEPEARMWALDGMAGGIQTWWHHVAAYHEDRRMYNTIEPLNRWHKANEEFLVNRRPIATVGVVWSQQNTDFYGRDDANQLVDLPWRGMTQALIRARIPYLPVHADHIDRDATQFSLLVLPNLGVMSDDQVASVRRFVESGGGVVATGQSSLFNKWGDPRADYALGDLFGAHLEDTYRDHDQATSLISDRTQHSYLRLSPELRSKVDGPQTGEEPPVIGNRHAVLQGFDETDILPFGGTLEPVRTVTGVEVPMTFIPQFPIYPPETAWMREPKTNIPGLILNTLRDSRIAFMPADLDRRFGRYNLPDHGNLLANLIHWAVKDDIPLTVEGEGLVDCHLYRQSDRLILHIVNLTSAGTWRAPIHELLNIGPLKVKIKLPEGVSGKNLRSLVSNQMISPTNVKNGWSQFEIKSVLDHEVVVIT